MEATIAVAAASKRRAQLVSALSLTAKVIEETTCLRKSLFIIHTLGVGGMQHFVSIGRSVFFKKDGSLGIISHPFNLLT